MASTMQDDEFTDVDLYGDLELDVNQQLAYNELKELCEKHETNAQTLQDENNSLKEQNDILKKNISSLFLTARNEITRKDAEIKRLQDIEVKNRKYGQRRRDDKATGSS